MARQRLSALRFLFLNLLIFAVIFSALPASPVSKAAPQLDSEWTADDEFGFVYRVEGGEVVCLPTTPDLSPFLFERDPDLELRVISRGGLSPQAGSEITFILRGTAQLEANQQAKTVFLRAADIWKSQLQSPVPITIIIDVDFGTTFFSTPFDEDVLGGTLSQQLTSDNTGYAAIRNSLIAGSETAEEVNLYNLLPPSPLPTNLGNLGSFTVPSALLRATGIIGPVADPNNEPNFGNPPRIGFNSAFNFDFDPTNGISPNAIDFEAVAVHEIGHLLGFASRVGASELGSTQTASVFDIFRFRPEVNLGTFNTAERILSSGGQQIFFAGTSELPLSTGRPDGSGGDGRQSSHWKDDVFVGSSIGIMDPTLSFGTRGVIGQNDLFALDRMGYRLVTDPSGKPGVNSAAGNLTGDVLTITGNVSDAQGDIVDAQTTLLATNGNVLRQDAPVSIDFGGATTASFTLLVNGLNSVLGATRARVVFRDQEGNSSDAVTVDFTLADAGGPNLKKVNFNGKKLVVKGTGLVGPLQVEVNGVIVDTFNNPKKKFKIGNGAASVNLQPGPNRVRVINNGLRSNIGVLNL